MPLIRPSLGPITAKGTYGWRQLPREPVTWHDGLDFAGGYDSPIRAVKAGVVVAAAPNGVYNRYGNVVVIKHDDASDGVPYTLYAHLSSMRVRKGQRVRAGQIIGGMGNLAATTKNPSARVATHLHFEIPSRFPLPPPDTGRIDPTPHIALAQRSVQAPAPAPVYSAAAPAPALYSQQAPLLYSQTSPMLSGALDSLGAAQSLNPLWYYLGAGAAALWLLGRARTQDRRYA
jgi:murein DD-endopeptidase MepM/ murein hydrolase activator NlpD